MRQIRCLGYAAFLCPFAKTNEPLLYRAAPPQFLDRIPGDESSSRLEAALRSSSLKPLLDLLRRCPWVLMTDAVVTDANEGFADLLSFREQLKLAPAVPTAQYRESRALFQTIGRRLVAPPSAVDDDWAAAAIGFFQQFDQALASLTFGWETGDANSVGLGASLLSDAGNLLQVALDRREQYAAFHSGCESWLGIVEP